jgi:hypothetical protein
MVQAEGGPKSGQCVVDIARREGRLSGSWLRAEESLAPRGRASRPHFQKSKKFNKRLSVSDDRPSCRNDCTERALTKTAFADFMRSFKVLGASAADFRA